MSGANVIPKFSLSGKVAVVTGAGRGFGKAIALYLHELGAVVGVVDLDGTSARAVSDTIAAGGGAAVGVKADVSQYGDVIDAVRQIEDALGPVDILVNNAGILQDGTVEVITDADWDRMMAVNLKGPFNCSKAVLSGMMERRRGVIVNIASMGGKSSWPLTGTHYSAAKGGVIALTKQMAKQVGAHGIRVNAVAPGTAETEMIQARDPKNLQWIVDHIPLGRLGRSQEVAWAVAFLASDAASYITGYTFDLNGGAYMD